MFANMAENKLSVSRSHFICHISQVRPLIRDKELRDKVWMRSSHHGSFKRLKDSSVMTFSFLGPVDTYNVALADLMWPSGDGHMFLVTNALSVVSYWQFFCVTCHVEARRGVWGETRAGDWEKVLEVITTFSTLLTDPGPGMIFARRSIESEWAGKTWHKIKNTS